MAVQPQAGGAPPQGNGNSAEEVSGDGMAHSAGTEMMSSASPPRASAMREMKSTQMARHAGRWADRLCTVQKSCLHMHTA